MKYLLYIGRTILFRISRFHAPKMLMILKDKLILLKSIFVKLFLVLFLNNSNKTKGYSITNIGGLTATLVDIRLILHKTQSCNSKLQLLLGILNSTAYLNIVLNLFSCILIF